MYKSPTVGQLAALQTFELELGRFTRVIKALCPDNELKNVALIKLVELHACVSGSIKEVILNE